MVDKLLSIAPRAASQVMVAEVAHQQFRLVQPRSMSRRESRSPPMMTSGPIRGRFARRVTRVPVLNQEDPVQSVVAPAKSPQLFDVMPGILLCHHGRLHPTGVKDQEQEQIHGTVARVLELLLLDRTRNGAPDRVALENLKVGDFIHRDGPDAHMGQIGRVRIAPEHFLSPLLEQRIESSCPPVAGAVRLQIHPLQDTTDHAWADGLDDFVRDGLTGQIGAGPMGNVQALGNRLKTGQLDDLRSLEGGKAVGVCLREAGPPAVDRDHIAHTDGKVARPLTGRNVDWTRRSVCVRPPRLPRLRERVAPGRTVAPDCGKRPGALGHRREKELADKAFGRAWEILREESKSIYHYSPANLLQDFVAGPLARDQRHKVAGCSRAGPSSAIQ
jgi:hypothetical protein